MTVGRAKVVVEVQGLDPSMGVHAVPRRQPRDVRGVGSLVGRLRVPNHQLFQ